MRYTALTLSGLALVLFACSSEAPSGSTRGGSTPAGTDKNKVNDDDNTPAQPGSSTTNPGSSTSPTEPAPSGGSCGSSAKMDACYECCEKAAGIAAVEKLRQAFGDCMCAPAKCGTQCAQTSCAATPKEPAQGDACDTCIQQQFEGCDTTAVAACEADANCKKLFECETASKCSEKPE